MGAGKSLAQSLPVSPEPGASLTLIGARLPGRAGTYDVEIVGGSVSRLAPAKKETGGTAGTQGKQVDLDGRWLIPGLWDNHVHFSQWSQTSRRLDLSGVGSAAEAALLVGERLEARRLADEPADRPLIGFGFRDGMWPHAPCRELLDAVSSHTPIVLISGDLHSCWLNTAALARYGMANRTSGLLREEDCFAVTRSLEAVPDSVMDGWAREAATAAAARGVVGIVDFEMAWNLESWVRRIDSGTASLRVEFGIYTQHLAAAIALGLRSGQVIEGTGGLLRVGPFKVIIDGSLNTRTAYCFDAYPGSGNEGHPHGQLTVPSDELVRLLRAAVDAGISPAVHAIGDHANSLALDAFEEIGCGGTVEHAQLLTQSDIDRFARLGICASMQPEHAMDDRDVADHFWSGRTNRAFPLGALQSAGVVLSLGSDAPVAPLDPWITIAAAVGRSRDGRQPWHPEQSISRVAALSASMRGRHTVAEGDIADLAICELDPLSASLEALRHMPVAATLVAGTFTHNGI